MSDTETASWIAALERARAELEGALSVDAHWHTPRGTAGDADWAGYEKTLAANPVYRCWAQLNEAIEDLRRQAQSEATTGRRRISLRDVLEQIRNDATLLGEAEPQAAGMEGMRSGPPQPPPDLEPPAAPLAEAAHAAPETEEATVSFVIREPAQLVAEEGGEASVVRRRAGPDAAASEPKSGRDGEAEVVIVPRRR